MEKTRASSRMLAESMFSRRHIPRIQNKIPRHTRFFISWENLLRPDTWHAGIAITDSQSWVRTRAGKKGKKAFVAEEAGGGKVCHRTLRWQHSPFARRVKTWRFSGFSAMVFMLRDCGQTLDLFPSVCSPLTYCNLLLTRNKVTHCNLTYLHTNVPAVQRWL